MADWTVDTLSPTLIVLLGVQAENKEDAIAKALCGKAGVIIGSIK